MTTLKTNPRTTYYTVEVPNPEATRARYVYLKRKPRVWLSAGFARIVKVNCEEKTAMLDMLKGKGE